MAYYQDDLGKEIAKRVQEHSRQTDKFIRNCEEFDRLFRCVPEERRSSEDGESRYFANTFVPEFFQDVETVTSAFDALLFTEVPWLTVAPDNLDDANQEKAENTQALLEKQAAGSSLYNPRLRVKMLPALRSFVINGTCVGSVPWEYRERTVADGMDFVTRVMRDGPGFRHIPLWRFFHDPFCTDISDALYCGEKYKTSPKEVRALVARAKSMVGAEVIELSDDIMKSGVSSGSGGDTEGNTVGENLRTNRGYTTENDKRPEVVIYWGENPDKPNSEVDWRIITVNGCTVAKMPNPYNHGMKPYVKGCFINLDESFYGLGLGAILKLPQIELNDFRNLMRDMLNMTLNGAYMSTGAPTASQSNQTMKLRPRAIFRTEKLGHLEPIKVDMQAVQHGLVMEDAVRTGMRSESAATAVQQGIPTDVSAREVSAMGNASDRRLLSLATVFVDSVLRPVLWFWHEMNKQYHTEPSLVTVQMPDGSMQQRGVQGRRVVTDPMTGIETMVSDLLDQPDIDIVLSLDADGRKGMIRRLTSALDNLVNVEKNLPGKVQIDFPPIIRELVRLMGIRPTNIVQRILPMMPGVVPGVEPSLQAPGEAPPLDIPPEQLPSGAVSEGLTPVAPLQPGQVGGIEPQLRQ